MFIGKLLRVALLGAVVAAPVLVAAAPAQAAILPPGGVTAVSVLTAFDLTSPKTAEAKCPAGKRVLGGGVRVNAGLHVVITREEPISAFSTGDSYLVSAEQDAVGQTTPWALQAYAICSDPIPGLRIVKAVSTTDSTFFLGVNANCPNGTQLLGVGGRILDGQGQVDLDTETQGTSAATAGGEETFAGFAGNWSVIAFAVCATARPIGDVQVVQTFSPTDTTANKIVEAPCPSGMTVTGGTGWADGGTVASTNVDANRTRIQVIANTKQAGAAFQAIAMALCAA